MYNNELIIPCEGLFSSFKMFPLVDLAGQQRPALRGWAATALGRQGGKDGGDEEGNLPCVFELLRCKGRFYCDLHKKREKPGELLENDVKIPPHVPAMPLGCGKNKMIFYNKIISTDTFLLFTPSF